MPNDCWNLLTITSYDNPSELKKLISTEFEDIYDGRIQYKADILRRGERGVILRKWSAWNPDFEWLEELLEKYPSCWIKNEWDEEGGGAGIWVGCVKEGEKQIKRMEWDDLCIEAKHFLFLNDDDNDNSNDTSYTNVYDEQIDV
jgi:hypothetical protein